MTINADSARLENAKVPSEALLQLGKAANNAFAIGSRLRTLKEVERLGLKVEDMERVVGGVLSDFLPGGPIAKGQEFVTSALTLYESLSSRERQDFTVFYEDVVTQGEWKIVPLVLPAGTAPPADPRNAFAASARYVVQLQWGGFQRKIFVDIGLMKVEQLRKQILEFQPDSTRESISREMRSRVQAFVQQNLNARIYLAPDSVLVWN